MLSNDREEYIDRKRCVFYYDTVKIIMHTAVFLKKRGTSTMVFTKKRDIDIVVFLEKRNAYTMVFARKRRMNQEILCVVLIKKTLREEELFTMPI